MALSKFNKYFLPVRALVVMVLMGAMLVACGPEAAQTSKFTYGGEALGTGYGIIFYGPTPSEFSENPEAFQRAIDSTFEVINQSMSTYWPDSDISKINRGDTTIQVDAMFREVFEESAYVYSATGGYFDPTVGVLVNAWGFGPEGALSMDSTRVDSLLQYVGFNKVELLSDGTVRMNPPGLRFDFNAIAKGYAIDRLAILLESRGVENYLVEVGGEVQVRGNHPDDMSPWRIGIDDPQAEGTRSIKKTVALKDIAMASSGNYRKFRIDSITGEKFVHTIDPLSGYTRNSNVLAVSILAPTCMRADAFATAGMAMDLETTKGLLANHADLEGYIIYLDSTGITREYMTEGFQRRVEGD